MGHNLLVRRYAVGIILGVFILGYASIMALMGGSAAGGSDSSGYFNSARMIARATLYEPVRRPPELQGIPLPADSFAPLGLRLGVDPDTIVARYAVGFPLHLAVAARLVGWDQAANLVNCLAWIAAALLLFALGGELGLPSSWSVAVVGVFGCFPVTFLHYIREMSDGLATTWCIACIYFALVGHRRRGFVFIAALSFSMAVFVRPTNLLLLPAVCLAVGLNPGALCALLAGSTPFAAALAFYNVSLYGKPVTTGYSGVGELVGWQNVGPVFVHFGTWLAKFLTPVALAVWVGGGIFGVLRRDRRHLVLLAWALSVIGFYFFYKESLAGWWRLRFILPAMPAVLLGVALTARDLSQWGYRRWGGARQGRLAVRAVLAITLACALGSCLYYVVTRKLWLVGRSEATYQRAIARIEQRIEPGAVVLCMQTSGAVYFYSTKAILRYDRLSPSVFRDLTARAVQGEFPLYALLSKPEELNLQQSGPTEWELLVRYEGISLWRPKANSSS